MGLLWCNTASALPKCIGEDTNKWTMCEATCAYEDGREYTGQWKKSERHGQGTFTYADGSIYVGEWLLSEHHGHGNLTYTNGKEYIGQFRNNNFIK